MGRLLDTSVSQGAPRIGRLVAPRLDFASSWPWCSIGWKRPVITGFYNDLIYNTLCLFGEWIYVFVVCLWGFLPINRFELMDTS